MKKILAELAVKDSVIDGLQSTIAKQNIENAISNCFNFGKVSSSREELLQRCFECRHDPKKVLPPNESYLYAKGSKRDSNAYHDKINTKIHVYHLLFVRVLPYNFFISIKIGNM
jgi:hypothetical protein